MPVAQQEAEPNAFATNLCLVESLNNGNPAI